MVRIPFVPRVRFSLRTFFVTLFVFSLIGSNLFVSFKWRQAQGENRRLRDELGHLTIDDPNRLHVISVPMAERYTWRWRIYVPDGWQRSFRALTYGIPSSGVPTDYWGWEAAGGEYTITAKLQKSEDGQWMFAVYQPGFAQPMLFRPGQDDWLRRDHGFTEKVAGTKGTQSFGPDEEVVLLRLHATTEIRPGVWGLVGTQDTDGAMLWMKAAK